MVHTIGAAGNRATLQCQCSRNINTIGIACYIASGNSSRSIDIPNVYAVFRTCNSASCHFQDRVSKSNVNTIIGGTTDGATGHVDDSLGSGVTGGGIGNYTIGTGNSAPIDVNLVVQPNAYQFSVDIGIPFNRCSAYGAAAS